MNKFYKVSIFTGVLIVVISGWSLFVDYRKISDGVFKEKKENIVKDIRQKSLDFIPDRSFSESDIVGDNFIFENFFNEIRTPEIFRIKIFNRTPKIVWSNLKDIIGEDASGNIDVENALEQGTVVLKLKSEKPEQVSERQFKEFTETYIPIIGESGENIGVIEVYQSNFAAREKISSEFRVRVIRTVFLSIIGAVASLFLAYLFLQ